MVLDSTPTTYPLASPALLPLLAPRKGNVLRTLCAALIMGAFFTSVSSILLATWWLQPTSGQPSASSISSPTTSSVRPIFTVPFDTDNGRNILPNINDPEAVSAQAVCPGYTASNVQSGSQGLTADLQLAGPPCHLYGNDIDALSLAVAYDADDRLGVQIQPRYISAENETWFTLPEALVPRPRHESNCTATSSKLEFSWSNSPTFSFTITRKETGDVLFTTEGSVLVYEDQFIEFVSPLPENYNVYGLGEAMHGFRLGNNLTS